VSFAAEFAVLGPLEVWVGGRRLALRGLRQRALLVALLLRRGRTVTLDQLVDEVFEQEPPEQARNALQTSVARLRQALGPAGALIVTRPPGYALQAPAEAVDAERFTTLLDRARAAARPAAERAVVLEEALGLWRGPAYGEFAGTFARGESARLEALRQAAREDRAALLLETGRVAEATAELAAMAAAAPWRERTVELLIGALAQAQRTVDALEVYVTYRTRLRDELGLDPSPALQRLHQEVLRGQIGPARSPAPEPPAPSLRGRLPRRATPIVGRERELAAVAAALAAGPLVTLVGPGGVGKTRLALEVAAGREPAWWVDLAALGEAAAAPHTVADTLGIDPQPGGQLLETLRTWARHTCGLIVLDNCEHLLAAVVRLVEVLLADTSQLRLLVTSRERLGCDGEQVLVIPPLGLPEPDPPDPPEPDAARPLAPAVRLFVDRARAADPSFTPDRRLLGRVGAICRALDGLPLAIELAAGRVGTLTVDDLADRLGADRVDARYELLDGTRRGGDVRHHTLSTVVDWSFALLTPQEQQTFTRLSVFAAAFDIATAEAVVAGEDLAASRVAGLLARLADRSMLTRPGHSGTGHYRLLETLRVYAASRLAPEETQRVRHRHARVMAELAERAEAGLYGPDEPHWARRIQTSLEDLRVAFTWARDSGHLDLAVRLAAALHRYAYWRLRADILAWGTWAVSAVERHPRLPVAYAAAAQAAWVQGHLDQAVALARQGITAAGGPTAPAAAAPLEALGDAAMVSGELTTAARAYQALIAVTPQGNLAALAISYANQALTATYDGDEPTAHAAAEQAATTALAAANPTAIAMARYAQGEVLADRDPNGATVALEQARERAKQVDNRFVAGLALTALVALRGRHGPPAPALALFRDAIRHWLVTRNRTLLVTALRNLVILLARTGRDAPAVALAATLQHAAPAPSYGTEAERITTALAAARQRLGQAAIPAELAGSGRTLEQAAEAVLGLLDGDAAR
jgi:predicted ATPase/DNA-binding SARP family transcriptional activator